MYKLEDVRAIHVEITEKCNLTCLMCDRNKSGGDVNPYLADREIPFESLKKILTKDFCKYLNRVYFCGNYGEPILSNNLLPIIQYIKQQSKSTRTSVITSACARPTYWWGELARVTNSVRFSIDGLEDTHKIYRQGADFDLIIRNAKAFIDAGGYAIWDYIVFGHNEHQVEEARKLSEELGFKEFIVKKTGRFFSNVKLKGKDEHKGLKKPKKEKNVNKSLQKEQAIVKKYGSMEKYLDQAKIDCKVLKTREIYISAEGLVMPCCWLAGQMYKWYLPEKSTEIWQYIDKEKHNINNHTLEEIFATGLFEQIEETWYKPSLADGKIKVCALKCGQELDQFGDQYK